LVKSLYAKLVLSLVALLFVTAVVYAAIAYYLTQRSFIVDLQRENADIAMYLADEITQTVSGSIDRNLTDQLFRTMPIVNPDVQLYLLDQEGNVLSSSAVEEQVLRKQVPLEPLQKFLAPGSTFPIFAQDPLTLQTDVTFAAAQLEVNHEVMGYLYITLRGEGSMFGGSSKLISTIGVAALLGSLLVSLLAGLYVFRRITSRLQWLSAEIETFRRLGFKQAQSYRLNVQDKSDDEIAKLGASYDAMANRIMHQIDLLEAQDQNRRSFIANISHDLRTPLTATQGYIEMLLQKGEGVDAKQREKYLGVALKHSRRLEKLIKGLFELAKLEDMSETIDEEMVSLTEIVGDVHQGCLPQAAEKDISIRTYGADRPYWVLGDLALIDRAISNIVTNAIQYTPEGGEIVVSLDETQDRKWVRISVQDNGPGIEPEVINNIFKRFYRADNEHSEKGNAGLGLAITQRIVELHGDTLTVESTGKGSRFSFHLPLGGPIADPVVDDVQQASASRG